MTIKQAKIKRKALLVLASVSWLLLDETQLRKAFHGNQGRVVQTGDRTPVVLEPRFRRRVPRLRLGPTRENRQRKRNLCVGIRTPFQLGGLTVQNALELLPRSVFLGQRVQEVLDVEVEVQVHLAANAFSMRLAGGRNDQLQSRPEVVDKLRLKGFSIVITANN